MASLWVLNPALVLRAAPTPPPQKGCTLCGPGPQTSGIPTARDRPGWEVPTPDGFSHGTEGSPVLLGLCEAEGPRVPQRHPLETSKAGTTISGEWFPQTTVPS